MPGEVQSFFYAIESRDASVVSSLLSMTPELAGAWRRTDYGGWESGLHVAARLGSLDLVRLLVSSGAEVYAVRQSDYPPVFEASDPAVVEFLMAASMERDEGQPPTYGCGIDIICAGRLGMLDRVLMHLPKDPFAVYRRGCIGESVLHWPAHNGHVEILSSLLSAGAVLEADEIGLYGGKPLHWASEHSPSTVSVLLERGADVHSRNLMPGSFHGYTPLHMCASQREQSVEVAELLIAAGASLSAVDELGLTPLEVARRNGHSVMAEFLAA